MMKSILFVISVWMLAPFTNIFAESGVEARTIILLRHAETEPDGSRDPVLSMSGEERARNLAHMLEKMNIEHILTSYLLRTRLTATPLARQKGLEINIRTMPEEVVSEIRQTGGHVVVVGHSNTVPEIIRLLGGPEFEISHDDYSGLYLLTIRGDEFISMIRLVY